MTADLPLVPLDRDLWPDADDETARRAGLDLRAADGTEIRLTVDPALGLLVTLRKGGRVVGAYLAEPRALAASVLAAHRTARSLSHA